jgi:hypothetical protein
VPSLAIIEPEFSRTQKSTGYSALVLPNSDAKPPGKPTCLSDLFAKRNTDLVLDKEGILTVLDDPPM